MSASKQVKQASEHAVLLGCTPASTHRVYLAGALLRFVVVVRDLLVVVVVVVVVVLVVERRLVVVLNVLVLAVVLESLAVTAVGIMEDIADEKGTFKNRSSVEAVLYWLQKSFAQAQTSSASSGRLSSGLLAVAGTQTGSGAVRFTSFPKSPASTREDRSESMPEEVRGFFQIGSNYLSPCTRRFEFNFNRKVFRGAIHTLSESFQSVRITFCYRVAS